MLNLLKQRVKENKTSCPEEELIPKRLGIKYDPLAIILEYLEPSSGKLYHHKMKLGRIKENDDSHAVFERLAKRHQRYLSRIVET